MYRHMVNTLCVNWVGTALYTFAILVVCLSERACCVMSVQCGFYVLVY